MYKIISKRPRIFVRAFILTAALLLAGCGDQQLSLWPDQLDQEQNLKATPKLVEEDPAGPIPAPDIPKPLLQDTMQYKEYVAAASSAHPAPAVKNQYFYKVEVVSPEAPELEEPFRSISILEQLKDSPPDSFTGLDMRVKSDLEKTRQVLDALGYYDGIAYARYVMPTEETRTESKPAQPDEKNQTTQTDSKVITVQIRFRPAQRYTLSKSSIIFTDTDKIFADDNPPLAKNSNERPRENTKPLKLESLADTGLKDGSFAITSDILSAVDATQAVLHNNGYPFAEITGTKYTVDYETKTLEAQVTITAGPLCHMGPLIISGEYNVDPKYIEALRTWREGQLWRDTRLERFGATLRETGLFQTINMKPAKAANEQGLLPVELELSSAPERTVSGGLKYNSDFGAGVQASWTHRNFTGHGDRLNIEMPIWQDMQILFAQYRLPFFFDTSQDFIAQAAIRNEDIDAYYIRSLSAAAGIERRFSRRFSGNIKVSAEGGELETPDDEEKIDYYMFGLPTSITYNATNHLLNATSGVKTTLTTSPYTGNYKDDFTVLRTLVDLTAYIPLMPGSGEDKLIMALKAKIGGVMGADSEHIPSTIRFYSGGGGSVRGYKYQSLGPRNKSNDPLGGASMTELSAEARWKAGDSWGLVAFIDGGMVYHDSNPDFSEELLWGAGLGLRYYTVIGPIRVDVATPVNGRSDDELFQLYISIGQSF